MGAVGDRGAGGPCPSPAWVCREGGAGRRWWDCSGGCRPQSPVLGLLAQVFGGLGAQPGAVGATGPGGAGGRCGDLDSHSLSALRLQRRILSASCPSPRWFPSPSSPSSSNPGRLLRGLRRLGVLTSRKASRGSTKVPVSAWRGVGRAGQMSPAHLSGRLFVGAPQAFLRGAGYFPCATQESCWRSPRPVTRHERMSPSPGCESVLRLNDGVRQRGSQGPGAVWVQPRGPTAPRWPGWALQPMLQPLGGPAARGSREACRPGGLPPLRCQPAGTRCVFGGCWGCSSAPHTWVACELTG